MRYEVQIAKHNYYTIEIEADVIATDEALEEALNDPDAVLGKALDEFLDGVWPDSTDTECLGIELLDDPEAEYYEANLIDNDAFDESTDEEFESILFGGK